MIKVQQYVTKQLEDLTSVELKDKMGVSSSMLSAYKHQGYNASLNAAKKVYAADKIVLHPFSEESLKYELKKDN
tara:strand:- start:712 stop:933 length:222 start_codon:yes stop_codon:yes gene_type:complete